MSKAEPSVSVAVTVDPEVCRGHGRCQALVPEAFTYDEDTDQSVPRGPDAIRRVPLEQLRLAASACPEGAITLDERELEGDS